MKAHESKRQKKGPRRGAPGYIEWCRNIAKGMRRNLLRRRSKGLLTLREIAVKHGYPYGFVVRKVALGELRVVQAGRQRYVHASEAQRVLGEESTAA